MRGAVGNFPLGDLSKLWDEGTQEWELERRLTLNPAVRSKSRQRRHQVVKIYFMCFKFLFS